MSGHIIYLWDATNHGQPQSFDAAILTFQTLITDIPEQPTSAKLAFAQRLQDLIRFGSDTDEELRRLYGNFVDKVKQHPFALLAVELPSNGYIPVMRMIVETATDLQLVAYDDQQGLVFLPSGHILPESRAQIWLGALAYLDSNKGFPKSLAEFENYTKPLVEEIMTRQGFKLAVIPQRKEPAYSKSASMLNKYIGVGYQKGKISYGIPVSINIKCVHVDEIYNKFNFFKSLSYATFYVELLNDLLEKKQTPNNSFEINQLDEILYRLRLIEKITFPLLDTVQDIKDLDNLVNGNVNIRFKEAMQGRGVYAPRCLIVARLANNTNFEELAVTLANPRSPGANEDALPIEWPKLVKYLREEVQPLV